MRQIRASVGSRRAVLWSIAMLGLAAGLVVSPVAPARHGAGHSCPAGAVPSACFYPPNPVLRAIEWGLVGLIAGCIVALVVWLAWMRPAIRYTPKIVVRTR
jgi:hypothetical protein